MFFSQIVLAKRGSLGKIWLAGHWDKKLAKNVVFKTNIPKSVKTILNPHSPMALRMTSHLLLGVVRIFSKKAKYLLNDCTEAVVKLKGLSKTVSKIDLPTEQDHQALLTSGPRQSDKPQVYQEVDRFLRNIDIRDLVVDPLYDPNKLEPVEKPDYSEFFGVVDEADLGGEGLNDGVQQTPNNNGTNNLIFDGTTTVTPASDRRFKSDELRKEEHNTMVATPDSTLIFGQGKTPKTPESTKSNIEMLIGDNINPLFNINLLDTPVLPKTPQQQLDFEDGGVVEFEKGMMGDQDQQPYEENEGFMHHGDDGHYAGPDGGQEEEPLPQFDEHGQPITPAKSIITDKDSEGGIPPIVGNIQDQLKATTVVEEKTEFEIKQLQQQLLLEKQKKETEKKIKPTTSRRRKLGSELSNKDIKKFKNTKALTVERSILPSNIRVIVAKTKEIPSKQQLQSAIRKNISNTFHNLYSQLLENKYPKVVQAVEEPYLSFLRSRIMSSRTIKNQELVESLQADNISATDLGIPSFEQDIDEIYEKKVEAALLISINNRIIADGSGLIAPSEKKKLKSQPFTEQDKELINRLEEEFEARANNKQPLFYKPDSNDMLREEQELAVQTSSPGSDLFKRNQQLLEEEERQRILRDQDMGAQFGNDEDNAGIGGYETEVENPLFHNYEDDTNIPEDHYSLTSAQPQQEEKKILSQKTANMHAILDKHFTQKNVINFLDDIVKPQQQVNPNNTRFAAACYFYELLVLKTKVLVDLKQPESDETYPDIQITKTSQFNNEFTVVKNVDL